MARKIGSFGLINYRRHPENPNFIVFGFNTLREAEIFEAELKKTKTWFEKDSEQTNECLVYLFAVSESSMDDANRANGMVKRQTKDPLFKHPLLRYGLLIFILGLSFIAIIGYVKNTPKSSEEIRTNQTDTTNLSE